MARQSSMPDNPLFGNPEEDMDDLTEHLERAMQTYEPAQDDVDLGDGSELTPGPGLDRYRLLDDESPSVLGGGTLPATLDHPNLTYGQLVAPSAHEDQRYGAGGLTGAAGAGGVPMQPLNPNGGEAGPSVAAVPLLAPQPPRAPGGVSTVAANQPIAFTVTDPVRREMGGIFGLKAGHVTYLVTTKLLATLPGYTRGSTFTVRRRFRDFVALAAALKARHRGIFLPPRPEKNAVEGQRMTDTFVEERRTALERYLNRLARHPVLATCDELRVFVETDVELEGSAAWAAVAPTPSVGLVEGTAKFSKQLLGLDHSVLDPVQAVQPTRRAADPLRALKETAQAMANNGAAAPELPPREAELRKEREAIEARRDALTVATRAAERLVHRMDRVSAVYGDAGLALFKVSKFEESDGPHLAQYTGTVRQSQSLSNGAKLVATCLVRSARILRRTVGRAAHELSVLHDQLAGMPPAVKGLRAREKQLLTTTTLNADVESRQRSIKDLEAAGAKVLGGDASKARRVDDLRNDVAKLQCSISASTAEYERIAAVNRQELARAKAEYAGDLLRMACGLSSSAATGAQRTAEVWLHLAGELEAPADVLAPIRAAVVEAQQLSNGALLAAPAGGPQHRLQYVAASREASLEGAASLGDALSSASAGMLARGTAPPHGQALLAGRS